MAFSRQRDFFGPVRHWGFACGMFYLFPCIFSFLALNTSDLARFPQKDSKASFKIFIHGDGPLF
jgi:hypothetical protein